jgi:hypothetical protein
MWSTVLTLIQTLINSRKTKTIFIISRLNHNKASSMALVLCNKGEIQANSSIRVMGYHMHKQCIIQIHLQVQRKALHSKYHNKLAIFLEQPVTFMVKFKMRGAIFLLNHNQSKMIHHSLPMLEGYKFLDRLHPKAKMQRDHQLQIEYLEVQ